VSNSLAVHFFGSDMIKAVRTAVIVNGINIITYIRLVF